MNLKRKIEHELNEAALVVLVMIVFGLGYIVFLVVLSAIYLVQAIF